MNDPTGNDQAQIQQLVRDGYIVRTRSDADTVEARADDTKTRDAAIAQRRAVREHRLPRARQGAVPGGYVVTLPGNRPWRCDPVNTGPASRARARHVESRRCGEVRRIAHVAGGSRVATRCTRKTHDAAAAAVAAPASARPARGLQCWHTQPTNGPPTTVVPEREQRVDRHHPPAELRRRPDLHVRVGGRAEEHRHRADRHQRDLDVELRGQRRGDHERDPEQRRARRRPCATSAGPACAAVSAPITVPTPRIAMRKPGEPGAAVEGVARQQREERREVVDERADDRDEHDRRADLGDAPRVREPLAHAAAVRWCRCGGRSSRVRIAASAPTTAKNDTAFTKNTHDVPDRRDRATPAIAGPVMRAEFTDRAVERDRVRRRCSRPTISSTNACCAGSSTTVTNPSATASANTIHTCTTPVSTISHSTTASTAASDCVTSSTLRRSKRSATAPPHSPNNSTGRNRNANVAPTAAPLRVSVSTSHASAMVCIQPPMWETRSPAKYRR